MSSRRQRRRREPEVSIKTPEQVAAMRQGGAILARALEAAARAAVPGATGLQLDKVAAEVIHSSGAKAAFLGHEGFPAHICVSMGAAVVHGIPDDTPFQEGDVVGIDCGVLFDGMITDGAVTVVVGKADADVTRLLEGTERARSAGIEVVRPGAHVGDVGAAIEAVLRRYRLGIIRHLVGHGVGHALWEPPEVPNYGPAGSGPILKPGMTIAIEPMATLGGEDIYIDAVDNWTVFTKDHTRAAQFEHTVLVTEDGYEILTIDPS